MHGRPDALLVVRRLHRLRRGAALAAEAGLFALGLGGDLFELEVLHDRQRLAGAALLGIAEGAAAGIHPFLDAAEEFALPVGKLDARLVGGAPRLPERIERRPLGLGLAVGRRLALRRLAAEGPARQIS